MWGGLKLKNVALNARKFRNETTYFRRASGYVAFTNLCGVFMVQWIVTTYTGSNGTGNRYSKRCVNRPDDLY